MTDTNITVDTLITRETELTSAKGKVAPFAYTQTAYDANTYEGVDSYAYAQEQNIPNGTATTLATNATVLNKGIRAQASSLSRMLVNHFFGRTSYNLNKIHDFFKTFLESYKTHLAQDNNFYSTTNTYHADDVCFVTADVNGKKSIRTFRCISTATAGIKNTPPVKSDGTTDTANWIEVAVYSDTSEYWEDLLADYPTLTSGEYLSENTATTNDQWSYTAYIPVRPDDVIYGNEHSTTIPTVECYDGAKTYKFQATCSDGKTTSLGAWEYTIPSGIYFIRVNIRTSGGLPAEQRFLVLSRNRSNNRVSLTVDPSKPESIFNSHTYFKGVQKAWIFGKADLIVYPSGYKEPQAVSMSNCYNIVNEMQTAFTDWAKSSTYGMMFGNDSTITHNGSFYVVCSNGTNSPYGSFESKVTDAFSMFHIAGSCVFNNVKIAVENVRYCVHDDQPVYTSNSYSSYHVTFNTCEMHHNGNVSTTYTSSAVIGGGTSDNSIHIFNGGYYACTMANTYKYPITYHNNAIPTSGRAFVILNNVILGAGQQFNIWDMDPSGSYLSAYINGCNVSLPTNVGSNTKGRLEIVETNNNNSILSTELGYYTGKLSYNKKPVYMRYFKANFARDDSKYWTIGNVGENVDLDVADIAGWYVFAAQHTTPRYSSFDIRLKPNGEVLVSTPNEYSYSTVDNFYVVVKLEYTLASDSPRP